MGALLCVLGATGALAGPLPAPLSKADFRQFDPQKAALGQRLFYDKILSGNRNIACATCHNPDFAGSDGLSLGVGEGGTGTGPTRTAGTGPDRIVARMPRNTQALWNLGHKDIRVLFRDGRLEPSDIYGNGFDSPAEEFLPEGLDSLLAAGALLPLTRPAEMAGQPEENQVAGAATKRIDAPWPIIAKRVRTIPAYGESFVAAFDRIERPSEVTIVEIANALAAFIGTEWRNHDSPFDAYLAGDRDALPARAKRGMGLFYGRARCDTCHSGPLLSDQRFYALSLPAFGPGRTRPFDPYARDVGRMGASDRLKDAYRFRTPPLRNVELTAPYGHNGAYPTLAGIVRHHAAPLVARDAWRPEMAHLPKAPWLADTDFVIRDDAAEMARQRARIDLPEIALDDRDIADLVAFLKSLTGRTAAERPFGRPESVPSGLPVD